VDIVLVPQVCRKQAGDAGKRLGEGDHKLLSPVTITIGLGRLEKVAAKGVCVFA
jgi:hypothetical protein